jgi:uncharacterized lipoprotein YddW (UPF0748 family)
LKLHACPSTGTLATALVVGALLVAVSSRPAARAPQDPPSPLPASEVRALWVTRQSLSTPESIAGMVRLAAGSGFNTLLVQVRGRGDAFYASRLEPRAEALTGRPAGFDPLATTIELARERGLRVHAWINVNLVSSGADLPNSRSHLVYQHPEWLMVPRPLAFELARTDIRSPEYLGRLARWTRSVSSDVEGLYASPLHPAAVDHVAGVVDEIVSAYAVDGVHLDYVRYPSAEFDYSRTALTAFRMQIDRELSAADRLRYGVRDMADLVGATDAFPARWADFRRSRLNTLVMRVRTVVKSRRPATTFSAAVYPDPAEAASTRLQDWRMWLDNKLIDVVCPMAYTPDAAVFATQIASVRQLAGEAPVWAGIGAYRLSSTQTVANIETARRLGAAGVVLFSYDSLVRPPNGLDYLSSIGRAAFAP